MKINSAAADILSLCFRGILGCIFVYAGIIKILDPNGFALAVYNYHILPGCMINIVAVILPWVEVVTGSALLLGVMVSGASFVISFLLLIFFLALAVSLARGLDISCGCFSTSADADPITWMYLFRDVFLFAMACFVFTCDKGHCGLAAIVRKMAGTPEESRQ